MTAKVPKCCTENIPNRPVRLSLQCRHAIHDVPTNKCGISGQYTNGLLSASHGTAGEYSMFGSPKRSALLSWLLHCGAILLILALTAVKPQTFQHIRDVLWIP